MEQIAGVHQERLTARSTLVPRAIDRGGDVSRAPSADAVRVRTRLERSVEIIRRDDTEESRPFRKFWLSSRNRSSGEYWFSRRKHLRGGYRFSKLVWGRTCNDQGQEPESGTSHQYQRLR